jgi:hypothetical protein
MEDDLPLRTLLELAEYDAVFLAVEGFKTYDGVRAVRVAFRAPKITGTGTAPIFDDTGEAELAGYGSTPAEAMAALLGKLATLPTPRQGPPQARQGPQTGGRLPP